MNTKFDYPKKCPCCNEGTISDIHDICLVCGWEDDKVQNEDPSYAGGANQDSLLEHRAKFQEHRKNDTSYMWWR